MHLILYGRSLNRSLNSLSLLPRWSKRRKAGARRRCSRVDNPRTPSSLRIGLVFVLSSIVRPTKAFRHSSPQFSASQSAQVSSKEPSPLCTATLLRLLPHHTVRPSSYSVHPPQLTPTSQAHPLQPSSCTHAAGHVTPLDQLVQLEPSRSLRDRPTASLEAEPPSQPSDSTHRPRSRAAAEWRVREE